MGEVKLALPHLDRGIALYDRERHGAIASRYGGHDPGTCCRYFLALSHWGLGYPERSLAVMHEATRLAEELGHAMSSTMTLGFASSILYLRGERSAALEAAQRCMAIIEAHAFWARARDVAVLLYAARGDRPDVATFDELRRGQGKADLRTWRYLLSGCIVAGLYCEAGAPERGLELLAALGDPERAGFYGSELYRLEGERARAWVHARKGELS